MNETLDNQFSDSELKITNQIKEHFITAGKWCRFLAIITFIFTGFMIIGAFGIIIMAAAIPFGAEQMIGMGVAYLVMGGLFIFPGLYLWNYGSKIIVAMQRTNQSEFGRAIQNMKSLFKFTGIYTIVIISLYILFAFIGIGMMAMVR